MESNDTFNGQVDAWRAATVDKLKAEISSQGIGHSEKASYPAAKTVLTSATGKKYGLVSRISFKFPRYMVFVHKGVGRGHPISDPREAKEWFNPVIEREVQGLADIVAENTADMIVSQSFERMKIR